MHPTARIVCVIVMAAFLSSGDSRVVVTVALLLALSYMVTAKVTFGEVIRPLWRMRWLFLAVVAIYLWLPSGVTFEAVGQSSVENGLMQGLRRASALALLVIAVNLLCKTTTREQLLGGVYWLATPIGYFGIPRERLALRLALALHFVPRVQGNLAQAVEVAKSAGHRLSVISDSVACLMRAVLDEAEATPLHSIEIHEFSHPSWAQWLYPLGLVLVLGVVKFSA
ncbi:MAG: energy-coupling factor transporter transmembrane protein EcfT [Gammaproteobacteria bacterium]|nr:energy-coupling factor transporter transmembrane protein EcfT [Gammaproteobacteria bacterium]MCI0591560.1 energy-coupling factor transporter transmembrane protein EcfT [Gammaproteobacteria bacterium]